MIKVVDNGVTYFFENREELHMAYQEAVQSEPIAEGSDMVTLMQYCVAAFSQCGSTIKNRLTPLELFERMQKAEQDLQITLEDM